MIRSRRSDIHADPQGRAPPSRRRRTESADQTSRPDTNMGGEPPQRCLQGGERRPRAPPSPATTEAGAGFSPGEYQTRSRVCLSVEVEAAQPPKLTPLVPPAEGTSKARPQEANDARTPNSPDPAWDLGFPPENLGGVARNTTSTMTSRRMWRPRASPTSVPMDCRDKLSPGDESQATTMYPW
jgi:hypothetical protein